MVQVGATTLDRRGERCLAPRASISNHPAQLTHKTAYMQQTYLVEKCWGNVPVPGKQIERGVPSAWTIGSARTELPGWKWDRRPHASTPMRRDTLRWMHGKEKKGSRDVRIRQYAERLESSKRYNIAGPRGLIGPYFVVIKAPAAAISDRENEQHCSAGKRRAAPHAVPRVYQIAQRSCLTLFPDIRACRLLY